jgi:hypothetical protein
LAPVAPLENEGFTLKHFSVVFVVCNRLNQVCVVVRLEGGVKTVTESERQLREKGKNKRIELFLFFHEHFVTVNYSLNEHW